MIGKIQRALTYNPRVFQSLQVQLQSGTRMARYANLALWVSFIAARVARAEMNRFRTLVAAWGANRGGARAVRPARRAPKKTVPARLLPRKVLIVAETSIPQCLRYRVEQKSATLGKMGAEIEVISWRNHQDCMAALPTCGCVIFYRTPAVKKVIRVAEEAHKLGLTTFFDIDDLVFDADSYRENRNLASLPKHEQRNLLLGADLYKQMLQFVDHAIGSTELISARLAPNVAGQTLTVENALDETLLALSETEFPRVSSPATTIFYGSGTDTHDADLALVAEPLAQVLREFPDVRLVLAGPLRLPDGLAEYQDRIIRLPSTDVATYYAMLARSDINLAPLEPGCFNDAKSNIKFLEASVLGLPSVCSPRAEFRRVIRHGGNGFLAETGDDWSACLSDLVRDPALRRRMGEDAKQEVLQSYHPEVRTRPQLQAVLDLAFADPTAPGSLSGRARLKVLVVNVHFPPEAFGGATIVAAELVGEMTRLDGVEIAVFTGTHDAGQSVGSLGRYEWKGVPVYVTRLPPVGSVPNDHESETMAGLFARVMDSVKPDVVHFHCLQMLSASLAGVCTRRGVPYVISLHDAWWICERQFMVTGTGHYCHQSGVDPLRCIGCTADAKFTLERFNFLWPILSGASHLLTPGSFFRDLYIRTGVDPDRITVSKNGVRPHTGRLGGASQGPRGRVVTFAYVGGRAVHKGYFWLREIFRGVEETGYVLRLVDLERVFGGSSMRPDEWKFGGRLEIADPYTQETLDDFFADVDVLLFPSLWKESFGLTVREALLRDIWVISTDCGGPVEDILRGVNGEVVPMGDTEAFRAAVRAVLADPDRIHRYVNPHKNEIRSFREQAEETRDLLLRIGRAQVADAQPPEKASRLHR
jgi:glycosyltransferase involved in cell wall biosynthesis